MRLNKNKSQLLMIFLAVGFFIGIIYENIVSKNDIMLYEMFQRSNLEQYLQTNIISEKYLWYVAKARILLLAIVCGLSLFKWKKLFVGLCLTVLGFLAGSMAVVSVIQLGMKGILLCIAGVFPQGIFYILAYSLLFIYWFRYPEMKWNHVKMIFVICAFLVGVLLEVYVNPLLVRLTIQIL